MPDWDNIVMKEIRSIRSADNGGAVLVEIWFWPEGSDFSGKCNIRRVYHLFPEQYRDLKITRGPVDDEKFELIETAGELCAAVKRGRFLLSFGANNAATLRQKLRISGFPAIVAAEAVEIILSEGIINENADAVREAERRVQHGDGRPKILGRLRDHGYCKEAIDAAIVYLNTVDFAEVCRRVIEKKYGALPTDADERRRAIASLMRLGFTGAQIREAESAIRNEEKNKDKSEPDAEV